MPPPPHLTPAQLAKQAERKAAKLARKAAMDNPRQLTPDEAARRRIIERRWTTVGSKPEGARTARVVTWNVGCLEIELTADAGANARPSVRLTGTRPLAAYARPRAVPRLRLPALERPQGAAAGRDGEPRRCRCHLPPGMRPAA